MGNTFNDATTATGATALMTIAELKRYMRITVSTYDTLLTELRDGTTNVIEDYCGRHFVAGSYAKWFNGTGENILYLDEVPVTAVAQLSIDTLNALSVTCGASDATHASVTVTATGVVLLVSDGASAGTTTRLFSGYATLALMAAAINSATGSWTATVQGNLDSYRSSQLQLMPAQFCASDTAAYLLIPDDPEEAFRYDADNGALMLEWGVFPEGQRNVYVAWTAGYSTIPNAVLSVCRELVAQMYNAGARNPTLQSERRAEYAWTAASGESVSGYLTSQQRARLAPYKDHLP